MPYLASLSAAYLHATFGVVCLYVIGILAAGYLFRRRSETASQFLHAGKMLPAGVTSLAFLAANCGALEIMGLAAASAKYGMLTLHFYWIGAIPAIIFLALFMMPVYAQSGAATLPEFLRLRYNDTLQMLVSVSLIVMMGFVSGISLYAIASLLQVFLGWNFFATILFTLAITSCYVSLGGLKGTIYSEVIQLAITVAGLVPLTYLILRRFHGLHGLVASVPDPMRHTWASLPTVDPKTAPMDVLGVIAGLGFVLSFGYWCTDFLLIQRALAARDMRGSVNTPLIAGFAKLVFPLLVVVPGLAAFSVLSSDVRFDETMPRVMTHFYGPAMLGLGVSAILASLMSALAGNIMGIATIWTHDVYKPRVSTAKSESQYLRMGRLSIAAATIFSIASAYLALLYSTMMDYLMLIFSLFNAPLFATMLLGVFTRWTTPVAAIAGLVSGMLAALAMNLAAHFGLLHYGSQMSANFYGAIGAFFVCLIASSLMSLFTQAKPAVEIEHVTFNSRMLRSTQTLRVSWLLAALLLATCILINISFW